MKPLDPDTVVKVAAGFAAVVAAIILALVGYFSQLKLKRLEFRQQERKEKSAQRLAFHLPLLRFCYELDGRIGRILENLHTDWLDEQHLTSIHQGNGFAQDPRQKGYLIMSSVYMFACFFGWTEAIKKGIDATRPPAETGRLHRRLTAIIGWCSARLRKRKQPRVFFFDHDISVVRRLFQFEELFVAYCASKKIVNARDACKLHRHFQHSIGEMMLHKDGTAFRCKTFREFFEEYRANDQFRYWFVPLEEMFANLSRFAPGKDIETQAEMKDDIRPLRLLAVRYWCRVLMRNLARDLGIDTPPPEQVLEGRSESLRATITSVKIEDLERNIILIRSHSI
jgi:hypothetical protein